MLAYRAAAGGKRRVNNDQSSNFLASARKLTFGAVALLAASVLSSASQAQSSGPFVGLAGNWSGGGTVTLDDGANERIRCRATYAVSAAGTGLNQTLTCASDSYKFSLSSNVVSQGGALTGTWTESSRGVSGSLEGRGAAGNFQVVASAPGFNANISLRTVGTKQTVTIKADSQFKGATISLNKI
jgi:hypothetical protein